MARRSAIDGAVFLLRDVRCDLQFAQLIDELGGVVALVGTQRRAGFRDAPFAIVSAASRSAVPVASVVSASTTMPLRFSISTRLK